MIIKKLTTYKDFITHNSHGNKKYSNYLGECKPPVCMTSYAKFHLQMRDAITSVKIDMRITGEIWKNKLFHGVEKW